MLSKKSMKEWFGALSPILIKPTTTSITVSLSKRFMIFQMMNKLFSTIEDDPYLNFLSLVKSYKVLGRILHGTADRFYKDRNSYYFKKFFMESGVYTQVKEDLNWLREQDVDLSTIKMTITKRGVIVYDNYKKNNFNLLLLTIHSGTWVPKDVQKKMTFTPKDRYAEEDIDTNRIYSTLVLKKGGIWVDNKQSRFACDFNREFDRCIYQDGSEPWIDRFWTEPLNERERKLLHESYKEFYFTLHRLVDAYNFNIVCDGHSMKDIDNRPDFSFGTEYTSNFYMPILFSTRKKLKRLGYPVIQFNKPWLASYITKWLNARFPHAFIFSAEINKKLYMTKDRMSVVEKNRNKLGADIAQIFDLETDMTEFIDEYPEHLEEEL